MFQDICNYLPNLEELSVRYDPLKEFVANEVPIVRLEKLKKFELTNLPSFDISPLLSHLVALKTLENLSVAFIRMNDEITQTLCELKTLRILKLTSVGGLNRDIYKKLASELPHLVEFHMIDCYNKIFSELSEFVKHSSNLKTIVFHRFYMDQPPFTLDMFSSLIEVLQMKQIQEPLSVHLNDDDLNNIKYDVESQCHNIIKLFPVEEESIAATIYHNFEDWVDDVFAH